MKKKIALFLYSKSSIMAQSWADAGIECHLFDIAHTGNSNKDNMIYHGGDIRKNRKLLGELCRNNECVFIGCFSPCTDLAISGTKHYEKKILNDAMIWAKAMGFYWHGVFLADFFDIPYFCENPRSIISTIDRKPDFKFDPCDFGGYLPDTHQHCLFPEIYPGQDAYNKETWIWGGNGFVFPELIPVSPVSDDYPGWALLGGKSDRTKEIRSCTPEGFARAVFLANYKPILKIAQ